MNPLRSRRQFVSILEKDLKKVNNLLVRNNLGDGNFNHLAQEKLGVTKHYYCIISVSKVLLKKMKSLTTVNSVEVKSATEALKQLNWNKVSISLETVK